MVAVPAFFRYLPIWSLWLFAFSCSPSRYLEVDQVLLKKNTTHIDKSDPVDNSGDLSYELTTLYKQKPNGKLFFFIPREWFYLRANEGDTSRLDRWKLRFLAEKPALYNPLLSDQTAKEMERYLQYKGYYDARVRYEEKLYGKGNKKASILYQVIPHGRYRIDSISFSAPGDELDSILQQSAPLTYFKKGEGLDGQLFELEKDRISKTMRNNGFAFFYPNFIPGIEVDTNQQTHASDVYLNVVTPQGQPTPKRYFIGDIFIYPNFSPEINPARLRDTTILELTFRDTAFDFFIKPEALRNAIFLRKGEPYQDDLYELTNHQLGALGVFKFVRIRQEIDTIFPNKLNFRIELTPTPRFEMGMDVELNYTNRSNAAGIGNLIGESLSPSVRHRNLFHGAEALVSKLSAGVEVNPRPDRGSFWNTVDLRFQSDLFWPRFRDYLGIWKLSSALFSKRPTMPSQVSLYDYMQRNATNRLSTSWNYVSLLNFYNYNLVHVGYGFDAQQSTRRYSVNHMGIDYLLPRFGEASDTILNRNPFFRNSFSRQMFVSLVFRDVNLVFANRPNKRGISHYMGFNAEVSGLELWAGNALYNQLAHTPDTLKIAGVPFSQYLRLDADYRVYKQQSAKRSLAARFYMGIVRPFGFSSNVHYVKQFLSGGPNSIRGWAARELGPGGHIDSLALTYPNPLFFYQAGDLKMEFNLEYRFPVLWALNGALFLDGGNIWTVRQDPTRPGSQFLFREATYPPDTNGAGGVYDPFYRQIALSPGVGMRLDFSYFIFRLDLGFKMRYPYRWDGTRFWNPPGNWLKNPNINLGLGLPF